MKLQLAKGSQFFLSENHEDWFPGFGFLESVYKNAMVIELTKKSLYVESERPLKVFYDNHVVGDFYIDLFLEDEIIVELKSVENITKAHEVQLVNYLNGLRKEIGLLINFGESVEIKRRIFGFDTRK